MVSRRPGRQGAFTLIELVITMIVVGILAVVILPKFFDNSVFASRGFHDETLAVLRYAQKAAVAQRHTVCVTFTSTSVTLRIASAPPPAIACNTDLSGPTGGAPYQIAAPSGVSYVGTPASFYFTALGQAGSAQTLQVAGVAKTITVEAETGYVYE